MPQTTTDVSPSAPVLPSTRYGLALSAFERAWNIEDIQSYLGIGSTQAYALAKDPSFPPRLRTGRAHRWNGLHVVAWLHHDDWRGVELPATGPSSTDGAQISEPSFGAVTTGHAARPAAHPAVPAPSEPLAVTSITRRHSPAPTASPAATGTVEDTATGTRRRVIDPDQVHRQAREERLAHITGGGPKAQPASAPATCAPRRKSA